MRTGRTGDIFAESCRDCTGTRLDAVAALPEAG